MQKKANSEKERTFTMSITRNLDTSLNLRTSFMIAGHVLRIGSAARAPPKITV